jgi:hypothetical protein
LSADAQVLHELDQYYPLWRMIYPDLANSNLSSLGSLLRCKIERIRIASTGYWTRL